MVDFHTHILPGIDDGSRDAAESAAMLAALAEQGISTVAVTPHFNAAHTPIPVFLERRAAALEAMPDTDLRLLPGAEIAYYPGISRLPDIGALKLGHTRLLLLEMPYDHWSEYTLGELRELSRSGEFTLLLAHIERYFEFQSMDIWNDLLDLGILTQSNASYFITRKTRRRALSLLRHGYIHLLGSDCHNTTSRPPNMGEALALIARKAGNEAMSDLRHLSHSLTRVCSR